MIPVIAVRYEIHRNGQQRIVKLLQRLFRPVIIWLWRTKRPTGGNDKMRARIDSEAHWCPEIDGKLDRTMGMDGQWQRVHSNNRKGHPQIDNEEIDCSALRLIHGKLGQSGANMCPLMRMAKAEFSMS